MTFRDRATLLDTLPIAAGDTPGYAAGSRFVANGEDAEAEVVNRGYGALAENTDDLDTRMTRDIAAPEVGVLTGHSGTTIVIDPSGGAAGDVNYTGTLYLGETGWTGQERLDQLFQLLDEDYNEVVIDGNEVKITSLTGNSLGDEFVATATTLNLNETLPSGNYRIGYYYGTTVGTMPAYTLTHAGLRGLEESPGEDKTGYNAIFSDGTNSTDGQYNGTDSVDALSTFTYGGRFLLKRGNYEFGTAPASLGTGVDLKTETFNFGGGATDYTSMALPATVSSDLTLGGRYEKLILLSKHATYQYILSNTHLEDVRVPPGAVKVTGDVRWIKGITLPGYTGSASTADYGVRFTGDNLRGYVENVWFEESASGGVNTPTVLIDEVTPAGNVRRHLHFKNCDFIAYTGSAVQINNVDMHITFEGCRFSGYEDYYAVACLGTHYDTDIRFVNCTFESSHRALLYADRAAYFENCRFVTGSSAPTSLVAIVRLDRGGMQDCIIDLAAGSIDGTELPTLIHLGDNSEGVVAKNVTINCAKVPGGIIVDLEGGSTENPSVYENITLDVPAAPTADRGVDTGLMSVNAAGSSGDTHKCLCKNLRVTSVTSDTMTDNGSVVVVFYAVVDGLYVDGVGSVGGSYKYGVQANEAIIHNLEYCPGGTIRCATNQITTGSETTISGGAIHKVLSTTGTQAIIDLGLKSRVIDMNCPSIETAVAGDYLLEGGAGAHFCVVEGNTFVFNVANPTNTAARVVYIQGDLARVNDNTIWITRSVAAAVTTAATGLIDSNIVDYNSGGATPTMVGGTTGTNVLTA